MAKMRTKFLSNLLLQGDDASVAAAWDLLGKLEKFGCATLPHYNVMLKACESSHEQRSARMAT